jgi:hypothetical protein
VKGEKNMSIKNILGVIKLQAIMIFLTVDVRHGSAILYYWDIPFSCHFSEPIVNIEIREQKKVYHISSLSAHI